MILVDLKQGSPAWVKHRLLLRNASEAPVMMGVSDYMTRDELIKLKATGIAPEIDAMTQARFDAGHRAEAEARPYAEEIIGEELLQLVATDDTGHYGASSDGSDMLCIVGFEHKLWNAELVASVKQGIVPKSHAPQLDQQISIFGFEKILFMVSDGTRENCVYCWYTTTQAQIDHLYSCWGQFDRDVEAYVPQAEVVKLVGSAPTALPALFVEVTGKVMSSTLPQFKKQAMLVLDNIKTSLITDQDFADADKTVKWCEDVEKKLASVKENALGQTVTIDELFKTIDEISAVTRDKRLLLKKLVTSEKDKRKQELVLGFRDEFRDHLQALRERVEVIFSFIEPEFGSVISGMRSLESMRSALGTALANAKVESNAVADRIEANRKVMVEPILMPDFVQVCMKSTEDFTNLYNSRKQKRDADEQARLADERARIQLEEQAKAEKVARDLAADQERQRVAAEQERQRLATAEAAAAAASAAASAAATARQVQIDADKARALDEARTRAAPSAGISGTTAFTDIAEVYRSQGHSGANAIASAEEAVASTQDAAQPTQDAANDANAKTMKMGEVCASLGFTVTADFLATLGIEPMAVIKGAKLYRADSMPRICRAIQIHLNTVSDKSLGGEAA